MISGLCIIFYVFNSIKAPSEAIPTGPLDQPFRSTRAFLLLRIQACPVASIPVDTDVEVLAESDTLLILYTVRSATSLAAPI
jgi:hypothetical protein